MKKRDIRVLNTTTNAVGINVEYMVRSYNHHFTMLRSLVKAKGVIGAGSCYSIRGTASVSEVFELTMKLCIVTVNVEEVEDVIFYGGRIGLRENIQSGASIKIGC